MFDFKPTLEDSLVKIRPLSPNDYDALFNISSDPLLWEQHPAKERSTPDGFKKWFEEAIATDKALYIEEVNTGKPVGTSRYKELEGHPAVVEIGWTFISREFWGKGYNNALKRLMIRHAFTHFDTIVFFVDKANFRSQRAVEKLGGKTILPPEGAELRAEKSMIYSLSREIFPE